MNPQEILIFGLVFSFFIFILPENVWAGTISQTMEGSNDIKITYPDSVVVGRDFVISFLVENNGWEDKQDIKFQLSNEDDSIIIHSNEILIDRLSAGGNYGTTGDFIVSENASKGIHFINIQYSQVLLSNNEIPLEPIHKDIAIPIIVKEEPKIIIRTTTPESIFANAEFPFDVELVSEYIDITDVSIQIIPPRDIEFRGNTQYTFSSIQHDSPISVTSRIITSQKEIQTEYKLPFEVVVKYTDDIGEEKTDSKTVSLLLRPRTFMELTTDGGIWIGSFFLAPYISIGTLVGIPAGTIISLLIRRSQNTRKKKKKKQ